MHRLKFVVWLCLVAILSIGALAVAQEKKAAVKKNATTQVAKVSYTCPMHPEVVSSEPGTCPKCNMKLQPVSADTQKAKESATKEQHKSHSGKMCKGDCSKCPEGEGK